MFRVAAIAIVLLFVVSACGRSRSGARADTRAESGTTVSPLAVFAARTPPLRVPRYDTSGSYPQVKGGSPDLRKVNEALRQAVLANERAYAPYARRAKPGTSYRENGVYRTAVEPTYLSASTVVFSALMPLTTEVFPGQHGGDGWLGVTVRIPSGTRVTITDLFKDPHAGLLALAKAWKARIRESSGGASCLRIYPEQYTPTVLHFREFALTPTGIAVGSWELEACYRLVAIVPYRVLRPYLSDLGSTLIAGVRRPQ